MQFFSRSFYTQSFWVYYVIVFQFALAVTATQQAYAQTSKITQLAYYFPYLEDEPHLETDPLLHAENTYFKKEVLLNLPGSVWQSVNSHHSHYGHTQSIILLKIEMSPSKTSRYLLIKDRYLDSIEVKGAIGNNSQASVLSDLEQQSHLNLNRSRSIKIPSETTIIYLSAIAKNNAPLIIPVQLMNQMEFDKFRIESPLKSGVFYGIGFLAFLICIFHYVINRQKTTMLIGGMCLILIVYTASSSNLFTLLPSMFHRLMSLEIQLVLLTAIGLFTMCIQLLSTQRQNKNKKKQPLKKYFNGATLLLLAPFTGYFFIDTYDFQYNAFKMIHFPFLLLAFVVSIIASATANSKEHTQSYLLLTWLFLMTAVLIEGSHFFGMDHTSIMHVNFVLLPEAFYTLSLICLVLRVLHQDTVFNNEKRIKLESIVDNISSKNKALEINHARSSDLAHTIYSTLRQPVMKLLHLAQTQKVVRAEELEDACKALEDNFQKITLLSQDLTESLTPQKINFKLHSLFERIPIALQHYTRDHHVLIHIEVDPNLPLYAKGDQSLLLKALLIILEHRIRQLNYSGINIYCTRVNDPRSPQIQLQIKIETGNTFNDKNQDHTWDSTPWFGSSDFQLILARDLILAMEGELTVSQDSSAGQCFICHITLERGQPPKTSSNAQGNILDEEGTPEKTSDNSETSHLPSLAVQRPELAGKHILVISDIPSDQMYIRSLFESTGMIYHGATTSEEAIQTCMIEDIDIILLDIELQKETCQNAYNHLKYVDNIKTKPIIGFSVSAENDQSAEQLGLDGFLKKPLNHDSFTNLINHLR